MPMYRSLCLAIPLGVILSIAGCESVSLKPRSLECTLAAVVAPASACQPMPRMSDAQDEEAKQFGPVAGKARVYVVRPSIIGGRYAWTIQVDGLPVGLIAEHTFLVLDLEPGPHEVAVQTGENRHALSLKLDEQEIRFVEVVSRLGLVESKAELRPLQREQGEASVRSSKRVALF
jgi:hypothetical protein